MVGKASASSLRQLLDAVLAHVPRIACERHRGVGRGEDQSSTRAQHAGDFAHEGCVVGDVLDHLKGDDEIERCVGEIERRHAHAPELDAGRRGDRCGSELVHRDETATAGAMRSMP